MLSLYQESQKNFYNSIIRSVLDNGKVSHAYFIETSGFADSLDLAKSFAKFLICTSHNVSDNNCGECNICHYIDEGICADFKIIEPDGLWIKKEQLLSLQSDFKTKSLDNNYRIYIINGADRLNKSAANSILKFLEEPEENIVAILLASNRYQVLNTIVSRCQLFHLANNVEEVKTEDDELILKVVEFAKTVEKSKFKTIAYYNQIFGNLLKTKDQLIQFCHLLQEYYESVMYYKLNRNIHISFASYEGEIEKSATLFSLEEVVKKIDIIYHLFEKIDFNANQSLLLDKLVIDLSGGV